MSVMSNKNSNNGVQFNPSYFRIADKYATMLTIVSYPKFISPGFLSEITSMSGIKIIMKHIPVSSNVLKWVINKEINEFHERYEKERDNASRELIKQDYDSLVDFVKDLDRHNDLVFDFQFHIMVVGNTREELEKRKINIKNYLAAMELKAVSLAFEQETILKSSLPIFSKQKVEERIGTPMSSNTLAGMFPYVFDSIKDPGLGNLIGVDFSGGVILFNQFLYKHRKEHNRNNANVIIFGNNDKDKYTMGKLLLSGNIRNDCRVVAIDPTGELEHMCNLCGGKSIDLINDSQVLINPFEIVNDSEGFNSNNGRGYILLEKNIQFLKAFMKYYYEDIEENILKKFSEVVQDVYHRFGININTDFSNKNSYEFPTFTDVYDDVKKKIISINEKNEERDILERLENKLRPFVRELKHFFDGHTEITNDSNFTIFDFKNITNSVNENVEKVLYFNVLKYAWGLCLDKQKDTIFYIDKVDNVLSNKNVFGVNYLSQIQARTRIYNTGTIMICHNSNVFSDSSYVTQSNSIIKNSSYCFVLQLNKSELNVLSKILELSDTEVDGIKRFQPEQALFMCGDKHMQIDIMVTQDELNFFGSGTGL